MESGVLCRFVHRRNIGMQMSSSYSYHLWNTQQNQKSSDKWTTDIIQGLRCLYLAGKVAKNVRIEQDKRVMPV